ncbi:MAG: substrate-binding domain-containing protein, partial [Candidatus Hinthialibacter sp.]
HEKVSLTGFDDLPFVDMIGLTTVHQPFREEGEKAVEIVHAMIQKGKRPSSVTIPSIVVVRESLKPPMQTNGWFGNAPAC